MKAKIILNPYANRWRAKGRADDILAACEQAGLEADLALIPAPGLGAQEAIRASDDGYDAVIAAGGDGTVHEVANGLIAAAGDGPTKPLGVMPVGTGNDFNDMSGLPRDLLSAAKIIAAGQTRQIDAGRITVGQDDGRCRPASPSSVFVWLSVMPACAVLARKEKAAESSGRRMFWIGLEEVPLVIRRRKVKL